MYRAENKDYEDDQQYQPGIFLLTFIEQSAPSLVRSLETYRQHLDIHVVHRSFYGLPGQLIGAYKVETHRDGIGLVFLTDRQARLFLYDAPDLRKLDPPLFSHLHRHIVHMPDIERLPGGGDQPDVGIFSVYRKPRYHSIEQRRI